MISEQLHKKINFAIKLLQSYSKASQEEPIEIAYSGGKDSDVILQLARESGIKYVARYKNTTIDPPGTIKHATDNGAEVIRPKKGFFDIVRMAGYPTRYSRICCKILKEYKISNKVVIGVRRAESAKRAKRYKEPTQCRIFRGGQKVEQIFPILEWSDDDVLQFILDRNIQLHPLYYKEDGTIDIKRRLGCMGCPLASEKHRLAEFKKNPKLLRAWIRAGQQFIDNRPDLKAAKLHSDGYEYFFNNLHLKTLADLNEYNNGFFGKPNYKQLLEDYFGCDLTIKTKKQ